MKAKGAAMTKPEASEQEPLKAKRECEDCGETCPTCAQPVKIVTVSIGGSKKVDYGLCKECGRQWRL